VIPHRCVSVQGVAGVADRGATLLATVLGSSVRGSLWGSATPATPGLPLRSRLFRPPRSPRSTTSTRRTPPLAPSRRVAVQQGGYLHRLRATFFKAISRP
jgi:hypothetical protein